MLHSGVTADHYRSRLWPSGLPRSRCGVASTLSGLRCRPRPRSLALGIGGGGGSLGGGGSSSSSLLLLSESLQGHTRQANSHPRSMHTILRVLRMAVCMMDSGTGDMMPAGFQDAQ